MAQNISKVIYNGNTLIDLTQDTVVADKLLVGYTAHGADGAVINGACPFDVDSSEVTAAQAEVLTGKTFAKAGQVLTGTMANNGAVSGVIKTKSEQYTVPLGFHDGSGKVGIDATEQAKLIAENIREGVTVLGVTGTMTGTEDAVAETVSVTPTASEQVILPNAEGGYNYLAQVTVAAIPYVEADNTAGGVTVTIG